MYKRWWANERTKIRVSSTKSPFILIVPRTLGTREQCRFRFTALRHDTPLIEGRGRCFKRIRVGVIDRTCDVPSIASITSVSRARHPLEPRVRPRPGVRDRNDAMPSDDGKITENPPPSITKRSETRARNPKPIGEPFVSTNRCRERITMRFLFSLRFSAVGRVKRVPLCPSTTTKGAPERVVISNYKVYDCEKRPLWLKARVSFTRLTTQKRFRARATSIASDRNVRIAADGDSNPCLKISPHENSSGTIWVKNLFFFFQIKIFLAYHLRAIQGPLVERLPQVGNRCPKRCN